MTRKIIVLAFVLSSIIACNSDKKENTNLHLMGNIEGLSQGKLYIQQVKDSSLVILDSIMIKGDSKFESFLNIESPEMLFLFLDRGQTNSIDNNLPFFAEPGEMKIETTLSSFFADAKISGSKNQVLYEEFKEMMTKFNDKNMGLVEKELENYTTKNKNSADSIASEASKLIRKKYLYIANFATVHADKEIAPFLALSEIADINVRYLDTIDSKMNAEVAKSKYGKMLKSYIEERKKVEQK